MGKCGVHILLTVGTIWARFSSHKPCFKAKRKRAPFLLYISQTFLLWTNNEAESTARIKDDRFGAADRNKVRAVRPLVLKEWTLNNGEEVIEQTHRTALVTKPATKKTLADGMRICRVGFAFDYMWWNEKVLVRVKSNLQRTMPMLSMSTTTQGKAWLDQAFNCVYIK